MTVYTTVLLIENSQTNENSQKSLIETKKFSFNI